LFPLSFNEKESRNCAPISTAFGADIINRISSARADIITKKRKKYVIIFFVIFLNVQKYSIGDILHIANKLVYIFLRRFLKNEGKFSKNVTWSIKDTRFLIENLSEQLKFLWRELYSEDWKELQVAFKKLAERLKPGVYGFGFLQR